MPANVKTTLKRLAVVATVLGLLLNPATIATGAAGAGSVHAPTLAQLFPDRATLPRASLAQGDLSDLSCANSHFCVAASSFEEFGGTESGLHDFIWIFKDGRWSGPTDIKGGVVDFVSCPVSNFCMGAGVLGQGAPAEYQIYNGSNWSKPASVTKLYPSSVSCSSAHFCALLLTGGANSSAPLQAATFNGSVWSKPVAIGHFYASQQSFSCVSATFCMLSTVQGLAKIQTVVRFNGSAWSSRPVAIPSGGSDEDLLSCGGPAFCIATGYGSGGFQAKKFNGSVWSEPIFLNAPESPTSLSCAKGGMCILTGNDTSNYEQALRYRAGAWSAPVVLYSTSNPKLRRP